MNFANEYDYAGKRVYLSDYKATLVGSDDAPPYLIDAQMYDETIKIGRLPLVPRHDFIRISFNIDNQFEISRVVEIIFYQFDTRVSDDNCYHFANED